MWPVLHSLWATGPCLTDVFCPGLRSCPQLPWFLRLLKGHLFLCLLPCAYYRYISQRRKQAQVSGSNEPPLPRMVPSPVIKAWMFQQRCSCCFGFVFYLAFPVSLGRGVGLLPLTFLSFSLFFFFYFRVVLIRSKLRRRDFLHTPCHTHAEPPPLSTPQPKQRLC